VDTLSGSSVVLIAVTMIMIAGIGALVFLVRRMHVSGKGDPTRVTEETVAVIAAAASVMLMRHVRVRRVRFLSAAPEPTWAVMGRLNIMASHAISRRKS
jgi:hypothetical protein